MAPDNFRQLPPASQPSERQPSELQPSSCLVPSWTIAQAQAEVDQWIQSIGVRYFSPLSNLAQLTEEVGELARVINRSYGDQSEKSGEHSTPLADKLADELADVLFVTICLANQCGIDLQSALASNLDKKSRRDGTRHHNNPKLHT